MHCLEKNKDIVDVAKSSLCINFDQTMVGIYYYSFIDSIVLITFEEKDFTKLDMILQFNHLFKLLIIINFKLIRS